MQLTCDLFAIAKFLYNNYYIITTSHISATVLLAAVEATSCSTKSSWTAIKWHTKNYKVCFLFLATIITNSNNRAGNCQYHNLAAKVAVWLSGNALVRLG